MGLAAGGGLGCREGFFGLVPNAEGGVGRGEEDLAILGDDVGGGDGQTPALFTVDEGQVDEDGAVVVLVVLGDGVDEAELLGDEVAGGVEDGEGQAMLAGHEVGLALGLGWRP